jgi:benzoyl-CoA reductase/2-hydroxyglutaryl-CoA dehydratase subunit BcrC/BadD/HgdB
MSETTLSFSEGGCRVGAQQAAPGQPIIGLVGAVVPPELVLAAGCLPLALMARPDDFGRRAEPMEDGHEPEIRSLFLQACAGEFTACDLMVVPSTSDGYRFLYQYLKEVQRQGHGEAIPPLAPYDFLFGRSVPVRRYSEQVLQRFADRLAVLCGRDIGDRELAGAIDLTNGVRAELRRLDWLRRAGKLDGVQAHGAIRAGAVIAPQTYRVQLAAWLDQLADGAVAAGPHLLVVSAVPLYHEALHAACEAAGLRVTAEDDEWGARRATPDIPNNGAPLPAIFSHYAQYAVSPRMLQSEREAWVTAQMRSGEFDAVLFYIPPSDQFFGWRYPALKQLAESCGLAHCLLREDILDSDAAHTAQAELAAFAATLNSNGAVK